MKHSVVVHTKCHFLRSMSKPFQPTHLPSTYLSTYIRFNGRFLGKRWLINSHSVFFLHLYRNRISGNKLFLWATEPTVSKHCRKQKTLNQKWPHQTFLHPSSTPLLLLFLLSNASMIRMMGGWVFLLVLAHPGSPGQKAVKQLLCVCCLRCQYHKLSQ